MSQSSTDRLAIGEAARLAGVAPSTLRYYEAAGLLPPPERRSGRRRYDPAVLQRLAVIDAAKEAGFSLEEIRELLDGLDGTLPSPERWQEMAARKLPVVEERIRAAQRVRRLLIEGISSVRLAGRPWGYPSVFAHRRGPGLTLVTLLFDTLLWRVPSGALRPWLATDWSTSADGRRHRFTLRGDVTWHDGRPLTAEDVAFTFAFLKQRCAGAAMVPLHALDRVEQVTAPDPHQVEVRLARPYAAFGDVVAGRVPILPAHVWSGVADPAAQRGPEAVLGSGPYRLDACDEREGWYRLRANDAYFLGPPLLQQLEFLPVPDQLEALEQGRIDVAVFVSDAGRPAAGRIAELDRPGYVVERRPGEWARHVYFDLSDGSVFADRRVRQAVAHAIDREALLAELMGDGGRLGSLGGLAPTHPAVPPDLPTYRHDPALASALLAEAGVRGGADGMRHPDGGPLRLTLLSDSHDEGAAERVQADLIAVGLAVEIVRRPPPQADAMIADGAYDLALVGYGGLGGDPDSLRQRLSARSGEPSRTRVHGYRNPRFEDVAEEQAVTLDAGRRAAVVAEMQRIVAADLPFLALHVPDQVTIAPAKHVFTAWRPTQGGVWGGYPGPLNKRNFLGDGAPA